MAMLVCSDCSTRYAQDLETCPHCGGRERVEEGSTQGSRLPFLDVTCPTAGCRAEDVVRRIHQPMIVPGVVERPTYVCVSCGAVMLPVAGWPGLAGMEENMPKITRHGGPTNAAADREEESAGRPPANDPAIEPPEREHQLNGPSEGIEVPADGTESPEITGDGSGEALPPVEQEGDEPSPGNSSSTFSETPPPSEETSSPAPRRRARTTASRSKAAQTESSTADGTDGSGPETPDEGKDD
ncbi:DNA-directed RNA polymerase subunit RPC12/RpoP [Nonomuraea thailandensis]|uniref:DNA-directed RNA polymerase subunit RPC12/RpoP n=1 Tax=Nonomuraea thailandensis TaxID=1188745 RepID=A0A9X2GSD5_9ACTN|nr:hypothetical protein [Nonomuraea thailandensis]MCP2364281.1 DNA-directed RNA polymerase subunit RPC12/RpoP [Nonomuraea thailandensis]